MEYEDAVAVDFSVASEPVIPGDALVMHDVQPFASSGIFGLERKIVSPGLLHQLNDSQLLGVSAVFATQSYGVSSLGLDSYEGQLPAGFRSIAYNPYS